MIFARKTTWRSRLDLEYLDETSSRKVSSRQQHDDGPKRIRPLRQFADYASKETLGQVHAGGFLHHLILINEDGSRTAPSQLTNEERKRRISEAWFEHIRKYPTSSKNPVIQHRLVFSMSRECTTSWSKPESIPTACCSPRRRRSWASSTSGFIRRTRLATPTGFITTRTTFTSMSRFARARREARMSDAARPGIRHRDTRTRWNFSARASSGRTNDGNRFSPRLKRLEEHLSRRLDSDKIVFSPRLNPSQMDALRNAQTAEAIRLQQLHQSIRNLEASITAKRKYFVLKRSANFVSRLVGRRVPKAARVAEKLADAVDRRSLREMRNLLFRIRAAIPRRPQTLRADTGVQLLCQSNRHRPSAAKRTLSSFSARDSRSGLPTWTAARTRSMRTVPPSPSSISSPTRRRFPDPERRLFDFLIRKLKPRRADESE